MQTLSMMVVGTLPNFIEYSESFPRISSDSVLSLSVQTTVSRLTILRLRSWSRNLHSRPGKAQSHQGRAASLLMKILDFMKPERLLDEVLFR